ncbi:MAG: hypothetical protein KDK39_03060 [Leptospiraceae bacterium]|nr:hypothetical protein [Leptospiraceae bacterium]
MSEDLWNSVTDGATDLWDDLFGDDEQEQPNDTDMATVDGGENGETGKEEQPEEEESTDRDPGEILMGNESADPVEVDATEFSACKYTSICASPAEKALQALLNEEVATTNYTIKMGDGTFIERKKGSAGAVLKTKNEGPLVLNGIADFKRLLEGSGGLEQIDKAESVDDLLNNAVSGYYG